LRARQERVFIKPSCNCDVLPRNGTFCETRKSPFLFCSPGVSIVSAKPAETNEKSQQPASPEASVLSAVNWDDTRMATHFANVVNIQSTLEQVDLFFGTNQTWNVPNDRRVQVELSNRIILSPHAAKRLWMALGGVLESYEARHGELRIEGR
jgi:Protein of unknown function (DUF3467)